MPPELNNRIVTWRMVAGALAGVVIMAASLYFTFQSGQASATQAVVLQHAERITRLEAFFQSIDHKLDALVAEHIGFRLHKH